MYPVDAVTISKTYLKCGSAEVLGLGGLEGGWDPPDPRFNSLLYRSWPNAN